MTDTSTDAPTEVARAGLDRLEATLGVQFHDRSLLLGSLAHRSWCAEATARRRTRRLEFLGDSVLGLVVTHTCWSTSRTSPRGTSPRVRAGVVNARRPGRGRARDRSRRPPPSRQGEDTAGGRAKQSILADAVRGGRRRGLPRPRPPTTRDLVLRLLRERIAEAVVGPGGRDSRRASRSWRRPRRSAGPATSSRRGPRPRQALLCGGVLR